MLKFGSQTRENDPSQALPADLPRAELLLEGLSLSDILKFIQAQAQRICDKEDDLEGMKEIKKNRHREEEQ